MEEGGFSSVVRLPGMGFAFDLIFVLNGELVMVFEHLNCVYD